MNRAFNYGDGIFETIKVLKGHPLYWEYHFDRLILGAELLHLEFDKNWLKTELKQAIAQETSDFPVARVRITVYRGGEGLYTPETNKIKWTISVSELEHAEYMLPEKGIELGIYDEVQVNCQPLSNIKTLNSLPYVLASIYKKSTGWDDVLIKNVQGRFSEATSANAFFIINNEVVTPSLAEGCVAGVMRRRVLETLRIIGIKLVERTVSIVELTEVSGIFLTNVISGICWVEKFTIVPGSLPKPHFLEELIKEL